MKINKLHYLGGDFILKQTVNPDPGMAVKEMFFTKKGSTIYVFLPKLPDKSLKINEMPVSSSAVVTLIGSDKKLNWKKYGKGIIITIPVFSVNELPFEDCYVLKISDITE